MTGNQEITAMTAIRKSEECANECRELLLDMNLENDQLVHDYNGLYDLIVSIRARITSVKHWNGDPAAILDEIEEMLAGVVE